MEWNWLERGSAEAKAVGCTDRAPHRIVNARQLHCGEQRVAQLAGRLVRSGAHTRPASAWQSGTSGTTCARRHGHRRTSPQERQRSCGAGEHDGDGCAGSADAAACLAEHARCRAAASSPKQLVTPGGTRVGEATAECSVSGALRTSSIAVWAHNP